MNDGPIEMMGCETCGFQCRTWCECPVRSCGYRIARCLKCGGDDQAMIAMENHIKAHEKIGPVP